MLSWPAVNSALLEKHLAGPQCPLPVRTWHAMHVLVFLPVLVIPVPENQLPLLQNRSVKEARKDLTVFLVFAIYIPVFISFPFVQ